jgi:hypothetical protein
MPSLVLAKCRRKLESHTERIERSPKVLLPKVSSIINSHSAMEMFSALTMVMASMQTPFEVRVAIGVREMTAYTGTSSAAHQSPPGLDAVI